MAKRMWVWIQVVVKVCPEADLPNNLMHACLSAYDQTATLEYGPRYPNDETESPGQWRAITEEVLAGVNDKCLVLSKQQHYE